MVSLFLILLAVNNTRHNELYSAGEDFWYPLDNAAKIYPAVKSRELTTVFRISAVLKQRVKISHLQIAIRAMEERFPYFKVKLKKGFFWFYLEHINMPISLEIDNGIPCREFNQNDKNKLMFRILAVNNRISIEFSHIITDGTAAFCFLRTLLNLYFEQDGIDISAGCDDILPDSILLKEEFEDSYKRYFKEDIPLNQRLSKAFHLPYSLRDKPRFDVLIAILSLDEIKNRAGEKGVSITVYLIGVYMLVLQDIYRSLNKSRHYRKSERLRIQVPINLRNIYPSRTMRNFTLFVIPEIDLRLGFYEFDEILKIVFHKLELETEEKVINKIIARNVGSEKKLFVRGIPLFIKSMILAFEYYSMGTSQYSGVITNLGKAHFSPEIDKRIEYCIFTPPPPDGNLKLNCGVIGCNDKLVLSFGNITSSKEFERKFLHFLNREGINVRLTKY